MADLSTNVRYIKGIGEQRAKKLEKLGIYSLRDLVMYLPRAYEDRRIVKDISSLIPGESCCVSAVVAGTPHLSHIRAGMDIVKLRAVDESASIQITFFNQPYVKNQLTTGSEYIFYGKIGGNPGRPEMVNPIFEKAEATGMITGRLVPIYGLTAGMTQSIMQKAVRQGLSDCGEILPDPIPVSIQREYQLAQARFSYENIHFPKDFESLELARKRFIFEELFVFACALKLMRDNKEKKRGYSFKKPDTEDFYKLLPFAPTNAQKKAVSEAFSDMEKDSPMSRLVQGDVGSGKTVVAAACCWNAAVNGYQSAFMVPTEILAEQHFETLKKMLDPAGLKIVLLTGGMTAALRRKAETAIASGEADIIVGTHTLISGNVQYKNLGLVVADEQHRFGVMQRAALTEKGDAPHVLVMSATPIPRTLAFIVYGELDVSILDELPPGRQAVETYAVGENYRQRIYNFIRKTVEEKHQVFIVCPAVEENEEQPDDFKAVTEYAKMLSENVFPDLKVAYVHGKMKPKEKTQIMNAFSSGETDILVSTTVIEVGVDVPNATLMVVENADRFGLSQLHQLRGRVGRGSAKSCCVLFEGAGGDRSLDRLKVMCKTNDGFKIAEEDLRLRGPGDFFGSRQHGLPEMHIANLASDMNVLKDSQTAAEKVILSDPELSMPENRELRLNVERILRNTESTIN